MRQNAVSPRRTATIRCFGLVLFIATVSLQTNSSLAFSVRDSSAKIQISSTYASRRIASTESSRLTLRRSTSSNSNGDESLDECHTKRRISGSKHTLLRKYVKAVALSTTLLYSPMATMPSACRVLRGSTAHAASTIPKSLTSGSDYNFQDFKDVKKKLSLAPGANVEAYEEILAKVEVEGEAALEDQKKGAALTIGDSGEEGEKGSSTAGDSETKARRRASKRAERRKQKKTQEVSEWESDEFGFGEADGDEDFDSSVLSFGGNTASITKLSPSKKSKLSEAGSGKDGGGDVVLTDKMAYNNYKASLSQEEKTSLIKKGAFYSIFPVFIITTIRGQIKAWKERKWVRKGLAIKEEERQNYLEEKKKKKEGKSDDDDDDGE